MSTPTSARQAPVPAEGQAPAAELRGISKEFGGVYAVKDVNLQLHRGEVLALVGENGAGKSTCVKMLGGVYTPTSGAVVVDGQEVSLRGPLDAQRLGIAVVHQHPGLFPDLSIAENVFGGHPLTSSMGIVDHTAMEKRAKSFLETLGLMVNPKMATGLLSTSEQQLVEIAKALASDAKTLILDEPTASLTVGETERLFTVIDGLKDRGVAMLFVGHRLEEIMRVSDRITVMRDGRWVTDLETAQTTQEVIVHQMVGRDLDDVYPAKKAGLGDDVLVVDNLTVPGQFNDVSLHVQAGEIVGLAGLVGAGRTEVARAIFGIEKPSNGQITLDGRPITVASPAAALAHGIAYVSEDRRGQSVVEDFSILDNATLPMVKEASTAGFLRRRAEFALVEGPLQRMRLKFSNYNQPISQLSGGNQQKVVLAKWLATKPRLLILDEPTQGVDIQAKSEVHHIIAELAEQGLPILMISSDMPELLGTCDRIYVMHQGRIAAEFDGATADQVDIGLAATGLWPLHEGSGEARPADLEQAAVEQSREVAVVEAPAKNRSGWRALLAKRELGLVLAIALVLLPLGVINPNLVSSSNLADIGVTAVLYGMVCFGQMLVMLTRNIDLSVGSIIGLSAYISADFMMSHPGSPIVMGIIIAMAVGLACGAVNGAIVGYGGVPAIVVTLGTQAIYRGIDALLSSGKQISSAMVPTGWLSWTAGSFLGISSITWMGLFLAVIMAFVLRRTRFGRNLYATGSNPDGAELIGIRTVRSTFYAFAISGLLAGLAGAMWASHYATVDGQLAYGLELTIVASVVVGGVSLRGGSGTVLGVVLGTVALIIIQNAITVARMNPSYLQAFFGAAILLTVTVDALLGRRGAASNRERH